MGRHRRKRGRHDIVPVIALAFGFGLFVALFCSVKLALIIASIALIYFGICYGSC